MKKKKTILKLITLSMLSATVFGCAGPSTSEPMIPTYKDLFDTSYEDHQNNVSKETITSGKLFYDDSYTEDYSLELSKNKDIKYEFYTENNMRFINSSEGFAVTLNATEVEFDYSLSQYRVQAKFNDSILTMTHESSSPYGNTKKGWETYRDEWLIRYLVNPDFLEDNNLKYLHSTTKKVYEELNLEIQTFSILINDNKQITHPYYNISVIRETNEYINFYLFVQKSSSDQYEEHIKIVESFRLVKDFGRSALHVGSLELKRNPLWNEETNAYYSRLLDVDTFDFGFFKYSLKDDNEVEQRDDHIEKVKIDTAWYKKKMDYDVEILPTYTHVGYYWTDTYFPLTSALELAGGNGFNGKPVLQFTLQYTRNNNNVSIYNLEDNHTPVYNVMRGRYDAYFRRLAQDIKAYAKPVLFRLNNEMNTDWTSYSGIISLLDPDIFQIGWRRLYDIFNEEGVDNCIWIFNPVADTCPHSSWSEDMCFMPGIEYVQALGITKYEMLNDDFHHLSFGQGYGESSALYKKNKKTWANYPWIISEFGCGSGGSNSGELYRNQHKQALWVEEMFEYFSDKENNDCVKRISGVVWFNTNDVVGDKIENALRIDDCLTETIEKFKNGFAKIKAKGYK